MAVKRDYQASYRILGVPFGSPLSITRPAYLHLVKTHHPDLGGSKEMAASVNNAFDEVKHYLQNVAPFVGANFRYEAPRAEQPKPKPKVRNTRGYNPLRAKVLRTFAEMERAGKPQAEILKFVMNEYGISWANTYYYWGRVYKKEAA